MGHWCGRLTVVVAFCTLIAALLAQIGYGGGGVFPNFLYSFCIGLMTWAVLEAGFALLPRRVFPLALVGGVLVGAVAGTLLGDAILASLYAETMSAGPHLREVMSLAVGFGAIVTTFIGAGLWLDQSDRQLEREQATLAELRAAHARIGESLAYAQRLQRAALPMADPAALGLSDLAVWWQPRDEVGGDVYCFARRGDQTALLVMDGTGHGVPGALIGFAALDVGERLLSGANSWSPEALLADLDARLRERLHREGGARQGDDGVEAGLAVYSRASGRVRYAGVGLHLIACGPDGADIFRGTRGGLAYRDMAMPDEPAVQAVSAAGTTFWLATDGALEQPGGEKRLQLGRKGFARMAQAATGGGDRPLGEAMADLQERFATWQNGETRRDDVTVLAFRA